MGFWPWKGGKVGGAGMRRIGKKLARLKVVKRGDFKGSMIPLKSS